MAMDLFHVRAGTQGYVRCSKDEITCVKSIVAKWNSLPRKSFPNPPHSLTPHHRLDSRTTQMDQQRGQRFSSPSDLPPKQSHSITPSSTTPTDSYPLPLQSKLTCYSDVMFKLLFFTAAMTILPLGTYWFSLNYVFQGRYPVFGGDADEQGIIIQRRGLRRLWLLMSCCLVISMWP